MALYGYYAHYLGWQKQAYKMALCLDKEHDFDLVHHVTWGGVNTGSWLCYVNKPFIFGPIGGGQVAPPAFKKYFLNYWRLEIIRSFMVKLIQLNRLVITTVRRADLVLVTNSDTFNLTRKLGARRIEFMSDIGLPENYFPPEPPIRLTSQELRLLWVGGIFPRKGLRLALESLTQVSEMVPFKMTILGGGFLSDRVPSWIEEFGLENCVTYRGEIPWIEVKDEYLNSDVFFFTSLRDSLGMQLFEAMACALPIVGLDHQGVGDFVPNNAGIKVPVNSPAETVKALARAIEYMFKHPEERSEMGKIGYEFTKTETWKQKALKMSEYYKEIGRQKVSS
jgi:glycosyltransferase involved in cell wall biosynthesis